MQNESFLSYSSLVGFWRRGFRNGNWGTLNIAEKGLFRCALWVAKVRGKISNMKLMVQVLKVALKLTEGFRSHVLKAGRRRAVTMYETYGKPNGVFSWVPRLKEWLCDPNYVLYLGILQVNAN